jgi:hypothetical protein
MAQQIDLGLKFPVFCLSFSWLLELGRHPLHLMSLHDCADVGRRTGMHITIVSLGVLAGDVRRDQLLHGPVSSRDDAGETRAHDVHSIFSLLCSSVMVGSFCWRFPVRDGRKGKGW